MQVQLIITRNEQQNDSNVGRVIGLKTTYIKNEHVC